MSKEVMICKNVVEIGEQWKDKAVIRETEERMVRQLARMVTKKELGKEKYTELCLWVMQMSRDLRQMDFGESYYYDMMKVNGVQQKFFDEIQRTAEHCKFNDWDKWCGIEYKFVMEFTVEFWLKERKVCCVDIAELEEGLKNKDIKGNSYALNFGGDIWSLPYELELKVVREYQEKYGVYAESIDYRK